MGDRRDSIFESIQSYYRRIRSAHFVFLLFEFVRGQIPHFLQSFGCLHDYSDPFSIRMTNLVCTGSFAAASFMASRATDSGTPSIS